MQKNQHAKTNFDYYGPISKMLYILLKGCNPSSLKSVVANFRTSYPSHSCRDGNVVFTCHNEHEDFNSRILHTISGVDVLTRFSVTDALTHFYHSKSK